MSTWGWKHSAIFGASVLCATCVLVFAGLSEPSTASAAVMTAGGR